MSCLEVVEVHQKLILDARKGSYYQSFSSISLLFAACSSIFNYFLLTFSTFASEEKNSNILGLSILTFSGSCKSLMTETFRQKKERNNLKSSDGFYLQPDIRIVGVVWTLTYLIGESTTNNTKIKQSNKTEQRTFDIVLSVSRTQLKAGTGLFISGATTLTNLRS